MKLFYLSPYLARVEYYTVWELILSNLIDFAGPKITWLPRKKSIRMKIKKNKIYWKKTFQTNFLSSLSLKLNHVGVVLTWLIQLGQCKDILADQ